jgi:glycosyltransferase involved in cell wall biosynthesis
MMKKHILHTAYSGLGGQASDMFNLLEDPDMRKDFDHSVLFFGVEDLWSDYAAKCTELGIPFRFIKKVGRLATRSHGEVARHIGSLRPDLVIVNGTSLTLPLLLHRAAIRGGWSILVRETQPNQLKSRQEWLGSYVAARWADAVVFLTAEHMREVEERFRLHFQKGRGNVIANGIDTDRFVLHPKRHSEILTLAMISRLVPFKDHKTLVDAMRILVRDRGHAGLQLCIAGEGETRRALETLAREAGLGEDVITFTGLLDSQGVMGLLAKTDIYLHCTFGEAMSNSILEAMAARLPIVASDVRGVNNNIRNGIDGLLVPAGAPEPLADAIERLIHSPELRATLADNARRHVVENLSRRRMAKEHGRLVGRLTAASKSPRPPAFALEGRELAPPV